MKKSIVILAAAAVFSLGITVYGWLFIESQVGEATLTEKTATGDIEVRFHSEQIHRIICTG